MKPWRSVALLQGFIRSVVFVRGIYLSRPRWRRTHVSTFACIRCISRRCSIVSSPRAWAHSRRSGRALRLFHASPRLPSAGRGARCLQLPSSESRIAGSSPSYYRVVQVDAHAPFDKGRLVVRRLVHESAYAGVLGRFDPVRWGPRAQKLSLGGIPRLAALIGS
jgi:hypothetical protein